MMNAKNAGIFRENGFYALLVLTCFLYIVWGVGHTLCLCWSISCARKLDIALRTVDWSSVAVNGDGGIFDSSGIDYSIIMIVCMCLFICLCILPF